MGFGKEQGDLHKMGDIVQASIVLLAKTPDALANASEAIEAYLKPAKKPPRAE
jgi:hypothetical protein